MILVLRWTRIALIIALGLLIGLAIASRAMPDNRLAARLTGDPSPAMRVEFEGRGPNYARCHAAKCLYA